MTKPAIEALDIIQTHLRSVLDALDAAAWATPSACPGWRVQDVFAHVTSNIKEVADPTPAAADASPAMTAEEAMEALVAPRKSWTPAELRDEYDRHVDAWRGALVAMQDEPLANQLIPVADLGMYAMHHLANAFAFDHYCHLRVDLLAPAGPLKIDLPPVTAAELRPGVEWMLTGLPQMQQAEMSVITGPLGLRLTGSGGGEWTLHPPGANGLIAVVEGLDARAVATVTSPAHDFVVWGTGRASWRDSCTIAGDVDYATRVLDAIKII